MSIKIENIGNGFVKGSQTEDDLEKAAYKYSFDSRPSIYGQVDVIDAFIAGAKWQKERMMRWSEEDEEMLEYIIGDVNDAQQLYATKDAKAMADEEIAWLKSLKERFKEDGE